MADQEIDLNKFSVKKLVVGKKTDIWKSIRYGLIFCLFLGICYFIYRGAEAMFPKPQNQNIVAEKGSKVTVINKADKRWFILFAEPYIGVSTNTKDEGRAEVGGRVGLRFEF